MCVVWVSAIAERNTNRSCGLILEDDQHPYTQAYPRLLKAASFEDYGVSELCSSDTIANARPGYDLQNVLNVYTFLPFEAT